MTNKLEAAIIRNQLALRFNTTYGCYEVFTTIHGTGVFRWYKISEAVAKWYESHFNLTPQHPFKDVDAESGTINGYKEIHDQKLIIGTVNHVRV